MKVEIPMTEVVAEQVVATERALRRVAEVLRGEAPGSFLRVSVNGGGCSGFQYSFDIAPAADDGDIILGNSEIAAGDRPGLARLPQGFPDRLCRRSDGLVLPR